MPIIPMRLPNRLREPEAGPQLSPLDVASLLCRARMLQRAALEGTTPKPLRGKNLGLLYETPCDAAQALFCDAAERLGARVATMRSSLSLDTPPQELRHTARMLGRLYEAVECQDMDPALVRQIGEHAGIPVFDGAAMEDHPAVRLAELLGDGTSLADNRRFMVQALLLEHIG